MNNPVLQQAEAVVRTLLAQLGINADAQKMTRIVRALLLAVARGG